MPYETVQPVSYEFYTVKIRHYSLTSIGDAMNRNRSIKFNKLNMALILDLFLYFYLWCIAENYFSCRDFLSHTRPSLHSNPRDFQKPVS